MTCARRRERERERERETERPRAMVYDMFSGAFKFEWKAGQTDRQTCSGAETP